MFKETKKTKEKEGEVRVLRPFEPVDFEKLAEEKSKIIKFTPNKEAAVKLTDAIREEIKKFQHGTSDLRVKKPMHFEKDTCPALNALNRFENDPNPENLKLFLITAKGDFGKKAAETFTEWSNNVFEKGVIEGDPKPVEKPFEDEISDIFYDVFRASGITLNQFQVENVRRMSKKLALRIERNINKKLNKLQNVTEKAFKIVGEEIDKVQ